MFPLPQDFEVPSEVVKSDLDRREYRTFTLDNGLEVVLGYEPKLTVSAAAMDVGVGSFFEPTKIKGVAHFLEHLLFLGSTKYPTESEFMTFCANNGGYTNAWTAPLNTKYYFQVAQGALEEGLDRWAQFFISPTFDPSGVDREVNAVHSEHQKNMQSDPWRFQDILASVSNPNHPANRFMCGNLETLKEQPEKDGSNSRQEAMNFYEKYYSANIMKLAIVSATPHDEMEAFVRRVFADIKNKNVELPPIDQLVSKDIRQVEPERLPMVLKQVPVGDLHIVSYIWEISESLQEWFARSSHVLSYIIGHEGKNSLYASLKARNLANGLTAGLSGVGEYKQKATISVTVPEEVITSPEKLQELTHIVSLFIKYLGVNDVPPHCYEDCKVQNELKFRFGQAAAASADAILLTSNMHFVPASLAFKFDALFFKYDPELYKRHMSEFTVDNLIVRIVSKKLETECTDVEHFYQAKHKVEGLTPELRTAIQKNLDLTNTEVNELAKLYDLDFPQPNPFFPEDLSLVNEQDFKTTLEQPTLPVELDDSCNFRARIFAVPDREFGTVKTTSVARIYLPFMDVTTPDALGYQMEEFADFKDLSLEHRYALLELFLTAISADMNVDFAYEASQANVDYRLDASERGINFSVSCYADKTAEFYSKFFSELRERTVPEATFNLVHERLLDHHKTQASTMDVLKIYNYFHKLCTQSPYVVHDHVRDFLQDLTYEKFMKFVPNISAFLPGAHVDLLIGGNLNETTAYTIAECIVDELQIGPDAPASRNLPAIEDRFPHREMIRVNKKNPNPEEKNAMAMIFLALHTSSLDMDDSDLDQYFRHAYLCNILGTMIQQPFFNEVRTKEQLGYITASVPRHSFASRYVLNLGVSGVRNGEFLRHRMEVALRNLLSGKPFTDALGNENSAVITESTFEEAKNGIIAQLSQLPESANKVFETIRAKFETRQPHHLAFAPQALEIVKSITYDDILQFINRTGVSDPSKWAGIIYVLEPQAEMETPTSPEEMEAAKEQIAVVSKVFDLDSFTEAHQIFDYLGDNALFGRTDDKPFSDAQLRSKRKMCGIFGC